MLTLEEVWENLRQNPETKATMEEAEKSYKLFKKIENLIVTDLETKLYKFAHRISDQNEEILKLKQQLTERQKKTNFKICRICEQEFEQSQNQTAIKELKKVRNLILEDEQIYIRLLDIDKLNEIFDRQITELKGEPKC